MKKKPGIKPNTLQDVWKRINIRGLDECWPHTQKSNSHGYGYMRIQKSTYLMHRIVFAIINPGVIELRAPKNKSLKQFVLHSCDNPKFRELAAHGERLASIGRQFGVSRSCIWDLVHGRTYRA